MSDSAAIDVCDLLPVSGEALPVRRCGAAAGPTRHCSRMCTAAHYISGVGLSVRGGGVAAGDGGGGRQVAPTCRHRCKGCETQGGGTTNHELKYYCTGMIRVPLLPSCSRPPSRQASCPPLPNVSSRSHSPSFRPRWTLPLPTSSELY